jgi:hypothetical protein
MNINLHIERLILDGLPIERNRAAHVQAVVEAELTRLFTENGIASHLQTDGVTPSLIANAIQLTIGGSPTQMGTQIAQSVYSGIGEAK